MSLVNHECHLFAVLTAILEELDRDVIFTVEEQDFRLHRIVLAKNSPVFAKMLMLSDFVESRQPKSMPINLPGKRATIFKIMTDYFYTGKIDLGLIALPDEIDLTMMAHEYHVDRLLSAITCHLMGIVDKSNALEILDSVGILLGMDSLTEQCLKCIDANALFFLESDDFLKLTIDAVIRIISRDHLAVQEADVAFAVDRWLNSCTSNKKFGSMLVPLVRISLLDYGNLNNDQITKLFRIMTSWEQYRYSINDGFELVEKSRLLEPKENMATAENGAIIVSSLVQKNNADDKSQTQNLFAWHLIGADSDGDHSITMRLARACLIDSVKLTLPTFYAGGWKSCNDTITNSKCRACLFEECRCAPRYHFTISTSMDGKDWMMVADCSDDYYGGTLLIVFKRRSVIYVKIQGVSEMRGKPEFRLEAFECPAVHPRIRASSDERTSILEIKSTKTLD